MNLVVVSNRVSRGKPNEPMTGGLAAALLPVVEKTGAIWVGSSGRVRDGNHKEPFAEVEALGAGALAMLDLPAAHYGGYYEGFANSALWPAMHSRADLIRASHEDYASYRAVNAFMARALLRFRKPDSVFWIQDYHFLALGAELRDLGVTQPIGFFLHTPWPARAVIAGVPNHRELIEAMLSYDLIGFQTDEDCENFLSYVQHDLDFEVRDGIINSSFGRTRAAVFPIGIDPGKFAQQATKAMTHPDVTRLRRSLNGEKLAIGVDRLDYSKGLPERFLSYERFLVRNPDLQGLVSFLQIAPPGREKVDTYQEIRAQLDSLSGRINGEFADIDWVPVRYVNRGYQREELAGIYRAARVALVTPLRDGMNLVAKEYVAAQDPEDPGALVLSRFAGAAPYLKGALLVNPLDPDEIAEALDQAMAMPLDERLARWTPMADEVRERTARSWCRAFLSALEG